MAARRLGSECREYRELVQHALEILIRERALSPDDGHLYLCQLARARNLLITQIAGGIVAGEWVWTEVPQEVTSAGGSKWLGCW